MKTEFEDDNQLLSNVSAATKELVDAFKANINIKKSYVKAQGQNKWMRMAETYLACGQQEKAMAILAKIEAEDDDEICGVTSVPSAVHLHQRGSDQQVTIRELESPLSTASTDDSSEKDD